MSEYIIIATKQGVAILAGMLITYLVTRLRGYKTENKSLSDGLQALLRDRIIQGYNYYEPLGWIPINAMEGLEACYNAYKGLGGNGVVTNLMDQLHRLPNIKPKEDNNND